MIKPLQQRATEKNCVNNEGVKNWQPSNIKVGRQNSLFKNKNKKKKKIKKKFTDQIFGIGIVLLG